MTAGGRAVAGGRRTGPFRPAAIVPPGAVHSGVELDVTVSTPAGAASTHTLSSAAPWRHATPTHEVAVFMRHAEGAHGE